MFLPPKYNLTSAFTLLELAIVIAIIGVLSSFAMVAFERIYEDRDAAALQGAMTTYQTVMIQGSQRIGTSPQNVDPDMIIQAIEPSEKIEWVKSGATGATVTIRNAIAIDFADARSATFRVNTCGDVCAIAIEGFTYYTLEANNVPCNDDPVESTCQYIAGL